MEHQDLIDAALALITEQFSSASVRKGTPQALTTAIEGASEAAADYLADLFRRARRDLPHLQFEQAVACDETDETEADEDDDQIKE